MSACRTVPDGTPYLPKHTPQLTEHPQRLYVEHGVDMGSEESWRVEVFRGRQP